VGRSLSTAARSVLAHAALEAHALGHERVGAEHVLLVLAEDSDTAAGRALAALDVDAAELRDELDGRAGLASLGIDLDEVRRRIEDVFGPGALARNGSPPRPLGRRLLAQARREARAAGCKQVGPEHLLLAAAGTGDAAGLLRSRGVSAERLRRALRQP
jgi:ATP-dependent Clp protease ATP-binding subunit ClpA